MGIQRNVENEDKERSRQAGGVSGSSLKGVGSSLSKQALGQPVSLGFTAASYDFLSAR